jgi:hypothetical protein
MSLDIPNVPNVPEVRFGGLSYVTLEPFATRMRK